MPFGSVPFKFVYRDFLLQAAQLLDLEALREGHERFSIIATKWNEVSSLFLQVADTQPLAPITTASELLAELSILEQEAMQSLHSQLPTHL